MFYLKPSKDSLQIITQLDAMNLISMTQVKKQEFIDRTKDNDEFQELEED
jgi:hypothetical protein